MFKLLTEKNLETETLAGDESVDMISMNGNDIGYTSITGSDGPRFRCQSSGSFTSKS